MTRLKHVRNFVSRLTVLPRVADACRWILMNAKEVSAYLSNRLKVTLRFARRNPIKAIGSLVLIAVVAYELIKNDVLIDDVEMQGSTKDMGYTGETLTQAAIAAIPNVIKARIERIPSLNAPLFSLVEKKSTLESDRVCQSRLQILPVDHKIMLNRLSSTEMTSENLVEVLVNDNKYKLLWLKLRQLLGIGTVRRLKPIIWSDNKKYFAKIYPSPSTVEERTASFDKLADAPATIADILLDYLSPELLAGELVEAGADNSQLDFPFKVAREFLNDYQKTLLIENIAAFNALDNSRTRADISTKYKLLKSLNELLLKDLDFSVFGKESAVIKFMIAERVLRADIFIQQYGERPDSQSSQEDMVRKHIAKFSNDLEHSIPGRIILAMYEIRLHETNAYTRRISSLMKENLADIREYVLLLDMVLMMLSIMLDANEFSGAEALLGLPILDNLKTIDAPNDKLVALSAYAAILKAAHGDIAEYESLVKTRFSRQACVEFLATTFIHNKLERLVADTTNSSKLINLASESYATLGASGIKSFDFFNSWGDLEQQAGRYQVAYEKYARALDFEGDHAWALLNWGNAALAERNYKLARNKFETSLSQAAVPAAIYGLLFTLSRIGDDIAFLNVFETYSNVIRGVYDSIKRGNLERVALSYSCRLGRPLKTTVLNAGEGLMMDKNPVARENVVNEACKTSGKS